MFFIHSFALSRGLSEKKEEKRKEKEGRKSRKLRKQTDQTEQTDQHLHALRVYVHMRGNLARTQYTAPW